MLGSFPFKSLHTISVFNGFPRERKRSERERGRRRMTGMVMVTRGGGCGGGGGNGGVVSGRSSHGGSDEQNQQQLSLLDFLLAALRKSMVSCRVHRHEEVMSTVHAMEIGWPTNVQHITHVTFDRFHGFLGLPVEFEVEIPCRVPSARFVNKPYPHHIFNFFNPLISNFSAHVSFLFLQIRRYLTPF